jgi:hypothetical protein
MDLAKVGDVEIYHVEGAGHPMAEVRQKLQEGWVVVSVKTVENHGSYRNISPALTVFVIGRPREKPRSPERELTEEELALLTHITDPQHPDHQLIRSIIGKKDWFALRLAEGHTHQKWLRETLEYTARISAKAGVPFPQGMELEEGEAWLKEHLPATDPDYPIKGRNAGNPEGW